MKGIPSVAQREIKREQNHFIGRKGISPSVSSCRTQTGRCICSSFVSFITFFFLVRAKIVVGVTYCISLCVLTAMGRLDGNIRQVWENWNSKHCLKTVAKA